VDQREQATILSGAAMAAVAGILLGGAMRPQLIFGDDRPMGPQMFAAGGGERSTGPFDPGGSYAAWGGQLPSYVIGTDYAQQAYVEAPPIAEERRQVASNDIEAPEAVASARAAYDEPPLPKVVYPSIAGGASYHDEAPPPPPPPDGDPTIPG
jgi:hypothetical protein